MRGPLAPPQVPLSLTRAETFDDLVRDAAERLREKWPALARVDFAVEEVPPAPTPDAGLLPGEPDQVPLGRVSPARGNRPDRVVVYRWPVEIRAHTQQERALLVHEVVVEQVAELLGLAPESVDPRYGDGHDDLP